MKTQKDVVEKDRKGEWEKEWLDNEEREGAF